MSSELYIILGAGNFWLTGTQSEFESPAIHEYELSPDLASPNNPTGLPAQGKKCCTPSNNNRYPGNGYRPGWDADNESMAKRAAEIHLRQTYHLNTSIQRIYDCCTDPDFLVRSCRFDTVNRVQGSVMWLPDTKQVGISACVNGIHQPCWYEYFVDLQGKLQLRNPRCIQKPAPCRH
jgi:hypothetical protein